MAAKQQSQLKHFSEDGTQNTEPSAQFTADMLKRFMQQRDIGSLILISINFPQIISPNLQKLLIAINELTYFSSLDVISESAE